MLLLSFGFKELISNGEIEQMFKFITSHIDHQKAKCNDKQGNSYKSLNVTCERTRLHAELSQHELACTKRKIPTYLADHRDKSYDYVTKAYFPNCPGMSYTHASRRLKSTNSYSSVRMGLR